MFQNILAKLKELFLRLKIQDISFGNIFWRKFTIRLLVLFVASIIVLNFVQTAAINISEQQIEKEIFETSLQLAQMGDKGKHNDRFATETNVELSELHEAIISNPFVVDASIYFYDLTNKRLVSKSFEIPVICSDDAIDWWEEQTNINDSVPTLSLTDEALEFGRKYKDYNLHVERVGCVNSVLLPSAIVATLDNGKEIDRLDMTIPTSLETMKIYPGQMAIKIVGNQIDDNIHRIMLDALLQSDQSFISGNISNENSDGQAQESTEETVESVKENVNVVYSNGFDNKMIKMMSKKFTINDVEYQIDCGYQVNFWLASWKIVAMIEVLGLLLCAASAFINTKETLLVYR